MVVDSSAVVAILYGEADAKTFAKAVEEASQRLMSAATVVESGIVLLATLGEEGAREFDGFLLDAEIEVVAVTDLHARVAREAFARFGKGRHPARLNFGDCFSYALAHVTGLPLLFKGNGFAQTDLISALAR